LPGAGKTLSAIEEKVLPAYLNKQVIYSNTFINLVGIRYFTDIDELLHVRNCVVFFDEIGDVVDAYAWDKVSQDVRRWFRFHRKRHVSILSTVQDISYFCKPARVLVTSHVLCENNDYPELIKKIFSWFGYGAVRVNQQELSAYELEKLQKGVGASPLVDDSDLESDEGFSDDLDLTELDKPLENPIVHRSYSYKKLLHKELDHLKIELVHKYCPECAGRQGEQILKENTFKEVFYNKKKKYYGLLTAEFCPSHPDVFLEVKESGIYDSEYELTISDVQVEWRPYVPSPAGHVRIPFKGALSPKLVSERLSLPKRLN